MKTKLIIIPPVLIILSILSNSVYGFDQDEHKALADSVCKSVMREIGDDGIRAESLDSGFHFGGLSIAGSQNDWSHDRFHERGKTVLDQLCSLTKDDLARVSDYKNVDNGMEDSIRISCYEYIKHSNVVATYLQYHLKAFQAAAHVDNDGSYDIEVALWHEAIAQSYLADAFSSAHMLVPLNNMLASLTRRNNIEAHNFHRDRGVYVISGRGDVWQAFGDGLMHWYAPTYRAVFKACQTSLKEVLLIYYEKAGRGIPQRLRLWADSVRGESTITELVDSWLSEQDGAAYYEKLRLPSLMHIPMPVAASWSHRTDKLDANGIRRHHHYPQLKDEGFHDPDLSDIDPDFLYARSSVPDWMVPLSLLSGEKSPDYLIQEDADWASVRWIQNRTAPPSYKGFLLLTGGQVALSRSDNRVSGKIGIGYGIWDDLLLVKNVSCGLTLMSGRRDADKYYLMPNLSAGMVLPGLSWFKAAHLEAGLGYRVSSGPNDLGLMYAFGVDSNVHALSFANIGLTWRLKYEWVKTDPVVHGLSLELILQ